MDAQTKQPTGLAFNGHIRTRDLEDTRVHKDSTSVKADSSGSEAPMSLYWLRMFHLPRLNQGPNENIPVRNYVSMRKQEFSREEPGILLRRMPAHKGNSG